MKTIKRDKGIKGKPTQDINTCNEIISKNNKQIIYYEVLECITTVNTHYNNLLYITKSEKKAKKLIKWLVNHNKNDQTVSYGLVKLEINELESKDGLGVLLKELSRIYY